MEQNRIELQLNRHTLALEQLQQALNDTHVGNRRAIADLAVAMGRVVGSARLREEVRAMLTSLDPGSNTAATVREEILRSAWTALRDRP